MFIVNLRFSDAKSKAPEFMATHNEWIKQGFESGSFLVVGSIQPNLGGSIIAHGLSREALEAVVKQDPFVAENIVTAEILEISPKKVDQRLDFLLS